MTKKYTIIGSALLILVLVGGGYYWSTKKVVEVPKSETEQAVVDIQKTVESINQSVVEGIFATTTVNPLEDVPDVNPYKDVNPFSDIKTNPFQ